MKEGAEVTESSASLMEFIIKNLLDYSLIKHGIFQQHITKFNIMETLEKVMKIQNKAARDKGIELFCSFENITKTENSNSPQLIQKQSFSPFICTDEQRLMQVLLNLQSNGIKFTEQGYVKISVSISQTLDMQRYLNIAVEDTGCGIEPEDQSKLFKLYGFCKDELSANTNGIGLGLSISNSIVQQLGGKFWFESQA